MTTIEDETVPAGDRIPQVDGVPLLLSKGAHPLSISQFAVAFEDPSTRITHRTEVDPYLVISAWLGTDHTDWADHPDPAGRPLIFGTIVYDSRTDTYLNEYEVFAPDQHTAAAQHTALVASLRTMTQSD